MLIMDTPKESGSLIQDLKDLKNGKIGYTSLATNHHKFILDTVKLVYFPSFYSTKKYMEDYISINIV